MYSEQFTVYGTLYTVHCTLYSVQYGETMCVLCRMLMGVIQGQRETSASASAGQPWHIVIVLAGKSLSGKVYYISSGKISLRGLIWKWICIKFLALQCLLYPLIASWVV